MINTPTEATPLLDYSLEPPPRDNDKVDKREAEAAVEVEEDVEKVLEEAELPRHVLAAWIVEWTMRGSPLESFASLPRTRRSRRSFLFFENTAWLRQLGVFGLIMLSFFETPSWCGGAKCEAPDGSSLFLSGVPRLDAIVVQCVNAGLLIVLLFFALFDMIAVRTTDLHGRATQLRVLLVLLVLDGLITLLYGGYPPVRVAPYLRAVLPLFYWASLRECTSAVAATVSPFVDAFAICTLFMLVFGWLITVLYHDAPSADRYFGNLRLGLYSTFTSLTTADWPMQIMGILSVSRASAFLFLVFIVVGVFLLFNVLLAVVYNAYTSQLSDRVVEKYRTRRASLRRSFRTLVDSPNGTCSLAEMRLMFDELRKNKKHSDLDEERIGLLFTALDANGDGSICEAEFLMVVEVMQLKFIVELEDVAPMERWFPAVHSSEWWTQVSRYVRSDACRVQMGLIMVANLLVILWESTMDLRKTDTLASTEFYALLEVAFSFVYITEMAVKVLSQGFNQFWRDLGNRFDFIVTLLLLFGAGYVLYPFAENDRTIVRYLVLLRCLRLFAVLADVPRFRRIVQVFSLLIPASVPLFTFLALSLYVFAAAGVELFGGLIYAGNPALDVEKNALVAPFVGNNYWTLNFNDMGAAWFMLFSSVIVGYLTEVAEAIAATSRFGEWTKWFFIASFVVNSLIVSNCVIAFVVDLFIEEDEQDGSWIIDNNDLRSRYVSKRVRVLHQPNSADQVYATMFRDQVEAMLQQNPS